MIVRNRAKEFKYTHNFVEALFAEDLHAKRVYSLANATLGVMTSASLAVSTIGHGLALARGGLSKHAIKQVDRLLSNPGIDTKELLSRWVPYIVGSRETIEVAMDWTDFDADNQATIMLSLITSHGRATPLVWLSVDKDTLKDNRNRYEYQVLIWLAEALPADVKVLIVADRGFGDHKLYRVLTEELKFDYLIRFRGNIKVTAADGEARTAIDWVGQRGRTRILRGAAVTAEGHLVGAVVCVQAKDMKEPWCLATSLSDEKAGILLKKYGKRWGIEIFQAWGTRRPHAKHKCSMARSRMPNRVVGSGALRIARTSSIVRCGTKFWSWRFTGMARICRTCSNAAGTRNSTNRMNDLIAASRLFRLAGLFLRTFSRSERKSSTRAASRSSRQSCEGLLPMRLLAKRSSRRKAYA
jgi:hypothetical protein